MTKVQIMFYVHVHVHVCDHSYIQFITCLNNVVSKLVFLFYTKSERLACTCTCVLQVISFTIS